MTGRSLFFILEIMIIIFILQALFGLVSPLNKQGLLYCSPIFFVAAKLLCAGFILACYHIYRYGSFHRIPKHHWFYYAQAIIIGNFCAHFLKYWGLQYVSAIKMAFIFNTAPFFVALFSYIRFGYQLTWLQGIGLIISFIGLIPILIPSSYEESMLGEFFIISWPELAILVATIMHAFSLTTKRILMHENNYWPVQVNAICFLGGGILASVYVLYGGYTQWPLVENIPMISFYIIITTLISKVICSTLYIYLMKYYTPTFLAFMDYWYVLFVAFWSWLLWGEQTTFYFWLSAFIVFCGQYLFYRDELLLSHTIKISEVLEPGLDKED